MASESAALFSETAISKLAMPFPNINYINSWAEASTSYISFREMRMKNNPEPPTQFFHCYPYGLFSTRLNHL